MSHSQYITKNRKRPALLFVRPGVTANQVRRRHPGAHVIDIQSGPDDLTLFRPWLTDQIKAAGARPVILFDSAPWAMDYALSRWGGRDG